MLEQDFRQRIVGRQLLQHLFVGRRLAGRRFLDDRQLHPLEQDLADLPRRSQVERTAGGLIGLLFERRHPLAELATLLREQLRVDQHAVPLHLEQHIAHRDLDVRIHVRKLGIGRDAGIEDAMQP